MSEYKRWIYILNDIEDYDLLDEGELFFDSENEILYLKSKSGYDIELNDSRIHAHIKNFDNPHRVTKDDLGLNRIPNAPLLSLKEFGIHINNENPHGITKEQVGLDIIKNYKFASNEDIINRAGDKYMSPSQIKYIVDERVSDQSDDEKIRISISTNTGSYIMSIRKRGSAFWTEGNIQIIDVGVYEYKLTSPGYYNKTGILKLDKDEDLYFDLDHNTGISFDRAKLDSTDDFVLAVSRSDQVYTWGNDYTSGSDGLSGIDNISIRHIHSHIDLFTIVYDNGEIYHWGTGINKYSFLNKIPKDIKYKSFVMNSRGCALLDIDGTLYCYGDPIFTDRAPTTGTFKQLHCNNSMFIVIDNNGNMIGWGEDNNNMLYRIPLGSYRYVSLTNTDAVAISSSGYVKKWGIDSDINVSDIPINEVSMVDINGGSIASLSSGGELTLGGHIKDLVPDSTIMGVYKNCLLPNPTTIVLINVDGGIEVYPKSISLLYTSKPTQNVF